MAVRLDAVVAGLPSVAAARCLSPPLHAGRDLGWAPERDWLELFADMAAHPMRKLPCERIAWLLAQTFGSKGCSYSCVVEDAAIGGLVWSVDGQTAPRISRASRDADAVRALVLAAWDDVRPAIQFSHCLSLPLSLGSAWTLAFVVGRDRPFRSAERRLASTLWTLLTALELRGEAETTKTESICLTPRERAVLTLLGEGLTAVAIAHRLGISIRTVHKHLERIYAKLDVTDRLAAVLAARRFGLMAAQ